MCKSLHAATVKDGEVVGKRKEKKNDGKIEKIM